MARGYCTACGELVPLGAPFVVRVKGYDVVRRKPLPHPDKRLTSVLRLSCVGAAMPI